MSSLSRVSQDGSGETKGETKKETPADIPSPIVEPLDELANHLMSVVADIQDAKGQYVARLQEVLATTRKTVEEETRKATEEHVGPTIRKELDAEYKIAMEIFREQYNGRLADAKQELENERVKLREKMAEFKRNDRSKVVQAELDRANLALTETESEIAKMVEDPDVELSKIIRQNAAQSELKAYLRGLQFQAETPQTAEDTTDTKETP